ncbi:helix-turn-helix transcriptional regulator [Catellatospora citrea]|uniref:helix-turn-helix transcriptional regulator n=1 Tax=Catellatospora citrea TaxID=53366 RepID=UPI0033C1D63B
MLHAQVVPSLMKWGVSPHADLVYRTLIAFGPWSVDSISRSLEMRARQVRSALDELTALGAAVPDRALAEIGRDERVWSSRAPAHVVSLLRDRHHRHAQARHRLERRQSRMASPDLVTDPLRIVASGARPVSSGPQVRARIAELNEAGRHEVLSMNPESAYSATAVKAAAPIGRKIAASGITTLNLGVPASEDDESGWHGEEMRCYGMQYRELPELPGRLVIVDRTTALVRKKRFEPAHGMWEVTAPELVAELTALFLQDWALATDPGRDWTPPASLSPRESTVVALLAWGFTDAAIASKLDISVRTIAYTLSSLMDRYDVTNRFQLGLRLGAEAAQQASGETATRHGPEGQQNR